MNIFYPENLANLIFQSSVVVCPYVDATQSGVVMSAFAFKKPVIVTNVGGLPEMVDHEKTGFIIEPKSSQAISDAISKLYNNRNLLEEMSQNIENKYFLGEKSWKVTADKFINVCEIIKKE